MIVMPQTPITGACVFTDRLRQQVEQNLPLTISGGVASAVDGDGPQTLLSEPTRLCIARRPRAAIAFTITTAWRSAPTVENEPSPQPAPLTETAETEASREPVA